MGSRPTSAARTPNRLSGTTPLYSAVKQMILDRIANGAWAPGHRVPSENELVAELGLSRMTINRALRELAIEGTLRRVQGLGTFVAEAKSSTGLVEIRAVIDTITERGNRYSASMVINEEERATPDVAEELEIGLAQPVFHTIIVHCENDLPVQLEDRYVNPALAPHYFEQDLTAITPDQFLAQRIGLTEAEHAIDAVLPANWEAKLLGVGRNEPCLLVRRRAFSGKKVATAARLLMPSGRLNIHSRMHIKL
ncbi:MAG: histidine utilization repressor [Ancalomicrobiaceae bacterium]|nr:histidine utilization repressor [Ancalomicrobiaceae bacterium]